MGQHEPLETTFLNISQFSAYMGTMQNIQSIKFWLNVIFYSLLSAGDKKNMCHLKSFYLEIQ